MLNCLLWLHTRTWTIMWWAGRTGTWPWTRSVGRPGLKTTSTAPSSWMHSATSSISSRLSTAWPTSGSSAGPFVSPDLRWSRTNLCSPQQVPVGRLPESWRVLQSENRPGLLRLHQTGWLSCSHHIEQVQELSFHALVGRSQVLLWFYSAGLHLWSSLRCGTPPWATSLPPLRLIRCSRLLGKHTDCWPLRNRLTFLIIKAANIFKYDANGIFIICCLNFLMTLGVLWMYFVTRAFWDASGVRTSYFCQSYRYSKSLSFNIYINVHVRDEMFPLSLIKKKKNSESVFSIYLIHLRHFHI